MKISPALLHTTAIAYKMLDMLIKSKPDLREGAPFMHKDPIKHTIYTSGPPSPNPQSSAPPRFRLPLPACSPLLSGHVKARSTYSGELLRRRFPNQIAGAAVGCSWLGPDKMVYHSSFVVDGDITTACGCPLLPLKTHIRGPAPASDPDKADIVDEAITFFRANVFFKNFHVKSPADKLLIYLTFYINIALKRLEGCRTLAVGTKAIINLGLEKVPVPGEPGFPFPGLFTLPVSQEEAELLRNYLKQIREETSGRLLNCAYRANGFPNKWWLAFAKRKFMNIVIL